ncbi:MAG TPA: glycosyltransferase family 4 protein [Terrimicrobiaceae bacterium]|nr:glycosyltransferase family 4 protein [Terrimicrobiaceae bacterium]
MKVHSSQAHFPKHIGFISTRFHGTDGVTLEAAKWAEILEAEGAKCFWMAGLLDKREDISHFEPIAFFNHPSVDEVQKELFGVTTRPREITDRIHEMKEKLKTSIYDFIKRFDLELLIPQNILAIPMHIPLGVAMTEVIAETGIPSIAHHHDFTWERERFTVTSGADYLASAFPPTLPSLVHVVINSMQQKELARRYGQASTIIPNVIDFETPPPVLDDYSRDFRREIGLSEDDILVLQPTRIVPRKGIEHAIELLRRLKEPRLKLVLSHPSGDEGDAYAKLLSERISDAGIQALFIADRIGERRGLNADGKKVYTLYDIYPHADLVTYPSYYEGFGNAFLEAVYFGKPVVVNTYAVYARDIDPLGFKTIEMSMIVTNEVVEKTREIIQDSSLRDEWAAINFDLGVKFFSYSVARRKLAGRIAKLFGEG